jgi:hypothetical protein
VTILETKIIFVGRIERQYAKDEMQVNGYCMSEIQKRTKVDCLRLGKALWKIAANWDFNLRWFNIQR